MLFVFYKIKIAYSCFYFSICLVNGLIEIVNGKIIKIQRPITVRDLQKGKGVVNKF